MRKSVRRKEIIKIFEKYSELGLSLGNRDVFYIIEQIKSKSTSKTEAKALLAVYITLFMLRAMGKDEEVDLICGVYLSNRSSCGSGLSMGMRRHSFETHRDERTLYRLIANVFELYDSVLSELLRSDASESIENNFSS